METKNVTELFDEVFTQQAERILEMEDEEARNEAIKQLVAMQKLHVEAEKNALDSAEAYDKRLMEDAHHKDEMNQKQEEAKQDRKKFLIGLGVNSAITISTMVGGFAFYNYQINKGIAADAKGLVPTNKWVTNLINRVSPNGIR